MGSSQSVHNKSVQDIKNSVTQISEQHCINISRNSQDININFVNSKVGIINITTVVFINGASCNLRASLSSEIFNELVLPFYNIGDYIKVHPTQLYEFIIYIIIFFYLIYKRSKKTFHGQIFCEYLILAGLSRFFIEYYRLNPSYFLNLTSAQILSIFMIFISMNIILIKKYHLNIWKK